jgi:hypothetical protein
MTATNHMLTGAVIATAVQQPWLVVPLAFMSHFVLDSVPHFGVGGHEGDIKTRNRHPLFRVVLAVDIAILCVALVLIPLLFSGKVSGWLILAGMVAAWLPDIVWVSHFWHDKKGHALKEPAWLTRFHQKIQWFERPPGLIAEVLWLGGTLTVLGVIAA